MKEEGGEKEWKKPLSKQYLMVGRASFKRLQFVTRPLS